MMRSTLRAPMGFVLAALICSPARGNVPPQPGTVNYVEGQASIGGQALSDNSVGSVKLEAGQSLTTQNGRVEILLTPGIFLRIDNGGSVEMGSPGLANTILTLRRGRVLVEVANILPENNIRLNAGSAGTRLLKPGLYGFDADHGVIRVFDGKAIVQVGGRQFDLKGGRQMNLSVTGMLKPEKFDKVRAEDDFYRWASLRSSYLTEANLNAASRYASGVGWTPDLWYGTGWYWDPWFDAFTFIPDDGIFYSPFGWGFYSPWLAYGAAPYFGYFGGYHHFGPAYRPHYGGPAYGYTGHAGNAFGGNFRNGGMRGASSFGRSGIGGGRMAGGFHGGGGGFHAGGGGFHGGGGGGHR